MPEQPAPDPKQFIQGAPVLHVEDPRASAEYYRDVLGFNFDFSMEEYSVVWRDNSAVHFTKGDVLATGVVLFQWLVDVDAYYNEVKSRGVKVTREPADQPYGVREFSILDPNGITVIFGQDI